LAIINEGEGAPNIHGKTPVPFHKEGYNKRERFMEGANSSISATIGRNQTDINNELSE
jgi:hypothetical protein